jgi:1-acyl-sn-glycerol-3-phosphate acyltransferase
MALVYRMIAGTLRWPVRLAYRIEREGWERVPRDGPAVLAANHESLLDAFFLPTATRRVVHYMAKAELFRNPILRLLMNGAGAFAVERGAADRSAINDGLGLLDRGELVGIFPQGTCLPYRERPWRRGAARLALEAGAPLVPVCLVNTEKALRPHRLKIGLPKVHVLVGEPLSPEGTAPELTSRLEAAVEALRAPHGPPDHVWIDGPPRRRL